MYQQLRSALYCTCILQSFKMIIPVLWLVVGRNSGSFRVGDSLTTKEHSSSHNQPVGMQLGDQEKKTSNDRPF